MKKKCLLIFFILLNSIFCLAGDVTIDRVLTYANDNKSSVVIHYSGTTNLRFFVLDSSDGVFVLDLPGVFSNFDFSTLAFGQVRRVEQVPLDPDESKGLSIRFYLEEKIEHNVFQDGPGTLTLFFEGGGPVETQPVARKEVMPIGMGGNPMQVLEGAPGEKRLSRIALDVDQDHGYIYLSGDGLSDYRTFSLSGPDRFVVDLKNTILSLPKNELLLDLPLVQRIRIRQFQTLPTPITRLVLDLSGETHVNVTPASKGLVLAFASNMTRLSQMLEQGVQEPEQLQTAPRQTDVEVDDSTGTEDVVAAAQTEDDVLEKPDVSQAAIKAVSEPNEQDVDVAAQTAPDTVVEPEVQATPVADVPQTETSMPASDLPVEELADDGPVVASDPIAEVTLSEQKPIEPNRGPTLDDGKTVVETSLKVADDEAHGAAVAPTQVVVEQQQAQTSLEELDPEPVAEASQVMESPEVKAEDLKALPADATLAEKGKTLGSDDLAEADDSAEQVQESAQVMPEAAQSVAAKPEQAPALQATPEANASPVENGVDQNTPPEVALNPDAIQSVADQSIGPEDMKAVENLVREGILLDKDDPSVFFPNEKKDGEVFEAYVPDDGKGDPLDLFRESLAESKKDAASFEASFEMASDIDMELADFASEKLPQTFYEMMKDVPSNRHNIGKVVVTNHTISLKETADMQDDEGLQLAEEGHELDREELEALFQGDSEFDTFASKEYRGFEIAIIDVREQPVLDLLRFIADQVGINLYVDPSVEDTRATYRFRNMPWDQVLDIILTNASLEKEFKNGVLRVATIEKFKKEAQEIASLREERELSVPTETVFRTLNYAKVRDVEPLVNEYLSPRGTLMTDRRTNTLIISDIPKKLVDIRNLLTRLDIMIAQVTIEARVVETTTRFLRELGIQWGLGAQYTPEIGNDTGLTFPNRIGVGGPTIRQDAGVGTGPSGGYAVNFPVVAENPSGIGLTLGNFLDNFKLEISLQLLETEGHGQIISSPKITTQNNKAAVIANGSKIPIQTIQRGTVTTKYVDAVLMLQVTPQITSDETIIMDILVNKSEPDFTRAAGAGGNPVINVSSAVTQVLVKNGGTAVIGGIFTVNEQLSSQGMPKLKNIPIIKRLFGSERKEYANQELLIFVTPRIVKY